MKRLSLLLAVLSLLSIRSAAESGSASLSCSGHVKLCESCSSQYYYIYAYQYASVYNGEVSSESHSFSMSGFLGSSDGYKMHKRATKRHVLYSNGKDTLAIPYQNSDDGIWVMGEGPASRPGEPPNVWVKLCPN